MTNRKSNPGRSSTAPITVIPDRYHGIYSGGGKFTAWPLPPEAVPSAVRADDTACTLFWRHVQEQRWAVGVGNTRAAAIRDLRRKLAAGYSPPGNYLADWLP